MGPPLHRLYVVADKMTEAACEKRSREVKKKRRIKEKGKRKEGHLKEEEASYSSLGRGGWDKRCLVLEAKIGRVAHFLWFVESMV